MEASLPQLPDVSTLRESFGDSKPPEISRKITACVACRRQKIKCHMANGKAPCARCKKRSLPCTVNRSLQMLLEDDLSWKKAVVQKVERLEYAISILAEKLNLPELRGLFGGQADDINAMLVDNRISMSSSVSSHAAQSSQDHSWEVTVDPQCEPSSMPASCIAPLRGSEIQESNMHYKPNLVSKGLITVEEAKILFAVYQDRLDHLLYRILGDDINLESAMKRQLFGTCLSEFKLLFRTESLSGQHNIDDVRGLCIGGFWLSSLSWALSGSAVRIASEIQLHHAIYKALDDDRDAYIKTRLYYHVYVCDHRTSILYGRPPMSHECTSINATKKFLATEYAVEDDVRLVSQVQIWSIYSEIFNCFGTETCQPLAPEQLPQLRRFTIALDTWYADWRDRFSPNQNVGNYPAKGVGLHFHFAKLYLCSHAFRGLDTTPSSTLVPELEDVANMAVVCATSILSTLNNDDEVQSLLNGFALCFDMMITFSVVFLLKVVTKYPCTIWMDKARILDIVNRTITILENETKMMNGKHLLVSVTPGLAKLVQKVQRAAAPAGVDRGSAHAPLSPDPSISRQSEMDWIHDFGRFENFDFNAMLADSNSWSVDLNFGRPEDDARTH
ncbi:hypothetical protein QQS21_004562 [Conoideocrella luteorostrata]|uniref:Zn(2)-C6 fungal-type domain-containing protein n=1 Tax=Conoideocrella luteorostrata TaxID=1105319 RepID=A0AAJ0FZQ7_9HYPO|nr:hypothetical protein QQS21_004562 [Conoideocrella luteorostrata]